MKIFQSILLALFTLAGCQHTQTLMPTPTAFEQEMLELINRARANPQGEFDALVRDAASLTAYNDDVTAALRYFNVAGCEPTGTIGQSTPKATLLVKVACEAATGGWLKTTVSGPT